MEQIAPAKLADLSKYSVLWDMMPDEVVVAAERMLEGSPQKAALLDVMRGLEMPAEVRAACARFDDFKKVAGQMVMMMADDVRKLSQQPLEHDDFLFAGRFRFQSIANQLMRKGQPWLADSLDVEWRDALINLNKGISEKSASIIHSYGEALLRTTSEEGQARLNRIIEKFQEPFMRPLPATLKQAMMLESLIADAAQARVTGGMGVKEVLNAYLKLANEEARKKTAGDDAKSKACHEATRFNVAYILMRGVAKVSEEGLDSAPGCGLDEKTGRWWAKALASMNKRYEAQNSRALFDKNEPLLKQGLPNLLAFHDEYCSPSSRLKEDKKVFPIRRNDEPSMGFSRKKLRTA